MSAIRIAAIAARGPEHALERAMALDHEPVTDEIAADRLTAAVRAGVPIDQVCAAGVAYINASTAKALRLTKNRTAA